VSTWYFNFIQPKQINPHTILGVIAGIRALRVFWEA